MLEGKSFDSEYSLFETCSFDSEYSSEKNERIKNSITDSLISQNTYQYSTADISLYLFIASVNILVIIFLFILFF
jgi:hypothetical protein